MSIKLQESVPIDYIFYVVIRNDNYYHHHESFIFETNRKSISQYESKFQEKKTKFVFCLSRYY